MLIREKIETARLTDAESALARFILEKGSDIENLTAREIAFQAGTVPSLLSRFSKKLGYEGWNSFKKEWIKESDYLLKSGREIDANLPFHPEDALKEVSVKLSLLLEQSIKDTQNLLDFQNLQRAVEILDNAHHIYCLGVANNVYLLESFASRLRKIGKNAILCPVKGEFQFSLSTARENDCILAISYSGNTPVVLEALQSNPLKGKMPVVLLTSLGSNSIRPYADVVLEISTREKLYSKIASFNTEASISYLLNLLYSCLFQQNPSKNYDYRVSLARSIEIRRKSDVKILSEEIDED